MQKDINQNLIDEIVIHSKDSNTSMHDNISKLLEIYNEQKKEIKKLQEQNASLTKEWNNRNIKDIKKDKMLEQQSKMAAMGEMMDAVAHQWKQPLNSISMMSDMLKTDFNDGIVDEQYVNEMTYSTTIQIEHMINTLNEFRNFFRPSNDNEHLFYLSDCITSVQILMKDELLSHNVNISVNVEHELNIYGLENEFKHLFLNLISNSIDAFEEEQTQKNLYIRAYNENTHTFIEFEDNAGGISKEVISDIFKPNVTTKSKDKGTGIGLYMSSQIVQKHHGSIEVRNTELGAFFTITLH